MDINWRQARCFYIAGVGIFLYIDINMKMGTTSREFASNETV